MSIFSYYMICDEIQKDSIKNFTVGKKYKAKYVMEQGGTKHKVMDNNKVWHNFSDVCEYVYFYQSYNAYKVIKPFCVFKVGDINHFTPTIKGDEFFCNEKLYKIKTYLEPI